jgi:hypothetical protein
MTEIEEYALYLANWFEDSKRPYNELKHWAFNHLPLPLQPHAAEIYFAGINILKFRGIENAKINRKPLTELSKADRAIMRTQGKELAAMLQLAIGLPCCVTKRPIKQDRQDSTVCYLEISISYGDQSSVNIHPTREKLQQWADRSQLDRMILVQELADRFKSSDRRIAENLEVIRANLEGLV